ncbi:MAG: alpha/beta fold hydrolase [Promethearchaeota archaeon]
MISEDFLKEGYVLTNGINLYYLEQGKGYPIILLHGGLGIAQTNWENLIPELSKYYHVIAPDCRGHGKTDNPIGEFSYNLMAEDIVGLIKILNLHKPIICGLSDGGQIALELAMDYPDYIKAIVVSGVLIEISDVYIKQLNNWGLEKAGIVNFDQLEAAWKDILPIVKSTHSQVYGSEYWKKFVQEISKLWLNPEEFPNENVKNINLPVLIVHGDHDLIPVEEALRIHNLIPNSELAVAPNSGHSFPVQNYVLYLNLISDFLKQHARNS